ncbi:MAG: hypothetical protein NTY76_03750 [Candidatus Omnitrophica bacterium]|nr:hypothetical protein [Candidatus Omnitrophota bacterium]
MSIIQEALEKAQSDVKDVKPAVQEIAKASGVKKAPVTKKAPIANKRALMAVVLLALMTFAVFSAGRFLSKIGDRTDRTSAANSQEVSYRPLVRDQAKSPNTAGSREQISVSPENLKAPESPKLVLNGIMYLDDGPRAIINNFIVGLGDSVSGAKVTRINRQSVILEYQNVEITLSLK